MVKGKCYSKLALDFHRVENIVGKGENAFSLFPNVLKSFIRVIRSWHCTVKCENMLVKVQSHVAFFFQHFLCRRMDILRAYRFCSLFVCLGVLMQKICNMAIT